MRLVSKTDLGDGFLGATYSTDRHLSWADRIDLLIRLARLPKVSEFELQSSYDEIQGLYALCSKTSGLEDFRTQCLAVGEGVLEGMVVVGDARFDLSVAADGHLAVFCEEGDFALWSGLVRQAQD